MIFRLMELTGVFPASAVIKVGDTVPDIEEGKSAGTWTIGITESGSDAGATIEEWQALPPAERKQRRAAAGEKLRQAGADAVIPTVAALPAALAEIEGRLRENARH
jgi:phosphonoacetaldehyde hydrolase